jgi:hypothetical protein
MVFADLEILQFETLHLSGRESSCGVQLLANRERVPSNLGRKVTQREL